MQDENAQWEVALPLKRFLTISDCPPGWKRYDLYLFRDEQVTFYAGQSYCAFNRVWDHIKSGPHGHSIIGRFILCNWPKSGSFTIELHNSQSPRFAGVGNTLDAAERFLIELYTPCFNVALNGQPHPLPEGYLPANASYKYLKSFKRMLREAGYVSRVNPDDLRWE